MIFNENTIYSRPSHWRSSVCFSPFFNKTFFPNVISGNYWSSTTLVNSTTKAWDINVDYGIVSYNEKTLKESVICVRGGEQER